VKLTSTNCSIGLNSNYAMVEATLMRCSYLKCEQNFVLLRYKRPLSTRSDKSAYYTHCNSGFNYDIKTKFSLF